MPPRTARNQPGPSDEELENNAIERIGQVIDEKLSGALAKLFGDGRATVADTRSRTPQTGAAAPPAANPPSSAEAALDIRAQVAAAVQAAKLEDKRTADEAAREARLKAAEDKLAGLERPPVQSRPIERFFRWRNDGE